MADRLMMMALAVAYAMAVLALVCRRRSVAVAGRSNCQGFAANMAFKIVMFRL